MLSLLDCLDPKNVGTASRLNLMKLGDAMVIDGEQLWHEFLMYKSFVRRLPRWLIAAAVRVMQSASP